MNRIIKKAFLGISVICGLASAASVKSPFVTVPWNGYSGAASFTFDDGFYQAEPLSQILEDMPEVKVTFFLTNMGMNLLNYFGPTYAELAKQGHEIGNHTNNHFDLTSIAESSLKSEIIDFAGELEQIMGSYGAEVSVTSHALPYSQNNDIVSSVIDDRHFINRSAGGPGKHDWNVEPNWSNMDSKVWYTTPNAEEDFLNSIDASAMVPSWLVLLNHGITDLGEGYITQDLMKEFIQRAVKNNMWVAPFSTVGAYYRAHFTLDTAKAVADGNNLTVTWEMPHKNMPKSIPLKVVINETFVRENFGNNASIYIEQDGKRINPDEDGIFILEFTSLKATIHGSTKTPDTKPYMVRSDLRTQDDPFSENTTYTLLDAKGRRLGNIIEFKVPDFMPKGPYIIISKTPGFAAKVRKVIH